ncbi:MAG TPA: hypothetical protein VLI94_00830 [Solirubrobacterales bacterium]|nr:hypothetical protein [Solirubrobacterales bacterium]
MSPIPYVRGQLVVLSVLIVLAAIVGAALVALCCAAVSLGLFCCFEARYRHDVSVMEGEIPSHRARLDTVMSNNAWGGLGPALLIALVALLVDSHPEGSTFDTARAALASLTIAATGVYSSSLVDWYVILPRISGQLGYRPCRDAHPAFPFPHSWKEVTRWWYIHRIVGALVFRVFVALAAAAIVGDLIGAGIQTKVAAGLIVGLFGPYMASIPDAVMQASQPKVLVGQTVLVKARARRQLLPPFRKLYPPDLPGRQYVVDVSLEGVHMTAAAPRETAELPPEEPFVRNPDRIALANLESARLAPRQFRGCQGGCAGINWYCIENPSCFEAK